MPDTVPGGGSLEASLPVRPWLDLRDTGLLWLINKVVLHPRGFALAVGPDGTGWTVLGDGSEVWQFMPDDDDDGFAKAEAFLASLRPDA